ncbi:hypothetical protein FACS189456_4230 [Bacteroidia bacterium]|nr:hypothetical protein FACS189456_4230 [Bacteroidia bacterium]
MLLFTANCARIGRPEGGPRDSAPPILLKTKPVYGATFFNKKRVRLTFNEYVVLKDQSKQFIMSPPMEKLPSLMIRGKSVVVDFNSPLAASTTYSLNFGNAIVDNNEGNVFPNYHFAFSSGGVVDSMRMMGLALDAATDQPLANVYACLYASDNDSAVLNQRPQHIARSDKWGFFTFENIKDIPYKIVLLSDENKNYKYDIGQEAIGFFDGKLNPTRLAPPPHWLVDTLQMDTGSNRQPQFTVRMFTEEVKKQFLITATRKEHKAFTLTFNAPFPRIDSMEAEGVNFSKIKPEYSAKHDTITFWVNDTATSLVDSLWLNFTYLKTDTAGNLTSVREKQKLFLDTKKETEQKEAKEKEAAKKKGGGIGGFLKGIVGISDSVPDTAPRKPAHWTLKPAFNTSGISPLQSPTFQFNALLFAVQARKIKVEEMRIHPKRKDTSYIVLKTTLKRDTLRLRHYTLAGDWKENTTYRYQILPDAFIDIYGQTNDTVQGTISTVNPEQAAILTFRWSNVKQPYVLQITDAKASKVFREHNVTSDVEKLDIPYLAPAAYRIKVIKDDNGNGKWDAGNYFTRRQPEYTTFLKNPDGTLDFTLKANWEQELAVDMNILFPEFKLQTTRRDFPFDGIFTEDEEWLTFCASDSTPDITAEPAEWLLFCDDDDNHPRIVTENEDWLVFSAESDTPEIIPQPIEYIEFCNDKQVAESDDWITFCNDCENEKQEQ